MGSFILSSPGKRPSSLSAFCRCVSPGLALSFSGCLLAGGHRHGCRGVRQIQRRLGELQCVIGFHVGVNLSGQKFDCGFDCSFHLGFISKGMPGKRPSCAVHSHIARSIARAPHLMQIAVDPQMPSSSSISSSPLQSCSHELALGPHRNNVSFLSSLIPAPRPLPLVDRCAGALSLRIQCMIRATQDRN